VAISFVASARGLLLHPLGNPDDERTHLTTALDRGSPSDFNVGLSLLVDPLRS
jgi:hypothetical protein